MNFRFFILSCYNISSAHWGSWFQEMLHTKKNETKDFIAPLGNRHFNSLLFSRTKSRNWQRAGGRAVSSKLLIDCCELFLPLWLSPLLIIQVPIFSLLLLSTCSKYFRLVPLFFSFSGRENSFGSSAQALANSRWKEKKEERVVLRSLLSFFLYFAVSQVSQLVGMAARQG